MQRLANSNFPFAAFIYTCFNTVFSMQNSILDYLSKEKSRFEMLLSMPIDPTGVLAAVFSKELHDISGVVDFRVVKRDRRANFLVFVREPDWKTEEQIYNTYADLLDSLPDTIDFQVIELFDRQPEDIISAPAE